MSKGLLTLTCSVFCWLSMYGQTPDSISNNRVANRALTSAISPSHSLVAVKSNLLYDATTSLNIGVELATGKRTSLDLSGNYNPWTFGENRKLKHFLIQPEFRLWNCQPFTGHFWGVHAHYAQYNAGGMLPWGFKDGKMFGIKNRQMASYRYEGWLVGGGISYGYHWIMSKRWGMEATIGVGYAYLSYDKFKCERCGEKIGEEHKNYVGPTKAGITLIYMIK